MAEKDEKSIPQSHLDSHIAIEHGEVFDENEEVLVGWRTWMAAISGASCVFSGYYVSPPLFPSTLVPYDALCLHPRTFRLGAAAVARLPAYTLGSLRVA